VVRGELFVGGGEAGVEEVLEEEEGVCRLPDRGPKP
jgi:hypothetical protein